MIREAVAEHPTAPRLAVRRALPDDAARIVEVLNPIIEARVYTVLDTPFTVEAERAFIERFPERGVFLVAVDETDGAIVARVDGIAADVIVIEKLLERVR